MRNVCDLTTLYNQILRYKKPHIHKNGTTRVRAPRRCSAGASAHGSSAAAMARVKITKSTRKKTGTIQCECKKDSCWLRIDRSRLGARLNLHLDLQQRNRPRNSLDSETPIDLTTRAEEPDEEQTYNTSDNTCQETPAVQAESVVKALRKVRNCRKFYRHDKIELFKPKKNTVLKKEFAPVLRHLVHTSRRISGHSASETEDSNSAEEDCIITGYNTRSKNTCSKPVPETVFGSSRTAEPEPEPDSTVRHESTSELVSLPSTSTGQSVGSFDDTVPYDEFENIKRAVEKSSKPNIGDEDSSTDVPRVHSETTTPLTNNNATSCQSQSENPTVPMEQEIATPNNQVNPNINDPQDLRTGQTKTDEKQSPLASIVTQPIIKPKENKTIFHIGTNEPIHNGYPYFGLLQNITNANPDLNNNNTSPETPQCIIRVPTTAPEPKPPNQLVNPKLPPNVTPQVIAKMQRPMNQPQNMQITNQSQNMHATNQPQNMHATNQPQNMQATNQPQYMPTSNQPQNMQTSNQPQNMQTTYHPQNMQVNNQPQNMQATNQPQNMQVINQPQYMQASNHPQYMQASNQPQYMQASNQPQNMQTTDQPQDMRITVHTQQRFEAPHVPRNMQPNVAPNLAAQNQPPNPNLRESTKTNYRTSSKQHKAYPLQQLMNNPHLMVQPHGSHMDGRRRASAMQIQERPIPVPPPMPQRHGGDNRQMPPLISGTRRMPNTVLDRQIPHPEIADGRPRIVINEIQHRPQLMYPQQVLFEHVGYTTNSVYPNQTNQDERINARYPNTCNNVHYPGQMQHQYNPACEAYGPSGNHYAMQQQQQQQYMNRQHYLQNHNATVTSGEYQALNLHYLAQQQQQLINAQQQQLLNTQQRSLQLNANAQLNPEQMQMYLPMQIHQQILSNNNRLLQNNAPVTRNTQQQQQNSLPIQQTNMEQFRVVQNKPNNTNATVISGQLEQNQINVEHNMSETVEPPLVASAESEQSNNNLQNNATSSVIVNSKALNTNETQLPVQNDLHECEIIYIPDDEPETQPNESQLENDSANKNDTSRQVETNEPQLNNDSANKTVTSKQLETNESQLKNDSANKNTTPNQLGTELVETIANRLNSSDPEVMKKRQHLNKNIGRLKKKKLDNPTSSGKPIGPHYVILGRNIRKALKQLLYDNTPEKPTIKEEVIVIPDDIIEIPDDEPPPPIPPRVPKTPTPTPTVQTPPKRITKRRHTTTEKPRPGENELPRPRSLAPPITNSETRPPHVQENRRTPNDNNEARPARVRSQPANTNENQYRSPSTNDHQEPTGSNSSMNPPRLQNTNVEGKAPVQRWYYGNDYNSRYQTTPPEHLDRNRRSHTPHPISDNSLRNQHPADNSDLGERSRSRCSTAIVSDHEPNDFVQPNQRPQSAGRTFVPEYDMPGPSRPLSRASRGLPIQCREMYPNGFDNSDRPPRAKARRLSNVDVFHEDPPPLNRQFALFPNNHPNRYDLQSHHNEPQGGYYGEYVPGNRTYEENRARNIQHHNSPLLIKLDTLDDHQRNPANPFLDINNDTGDPFLVEDDLSTVSLDFNIPEPDHEPRLFNNQRDVMGYRTNYNFDLNSTLREHNTYLRLLETHSNKRLFRFYDFVTTLQIRSGTQPYGLSEFIRLLKEGKLRNYKLLFHKNPNLRD